MSGFGDILRRERESRDTTLEDVAHRTRIGIQYLEALERGDFDGLPGRSGFAKLYIRIYAEVFGFDPEPVISAYDRERLEHEPRNDAEARDEPERPRRVQFVPRARRSPSAERKTQATGAVVPPTEPPAASDAAPAAELAGSAAPGAHSEPELVPAVVPSMAPRAAGAAALAGPAVSGALSDLDPAPDAGLAEPPAPPVTPAELSGTSSDPDPVQKVSPAELPAPPVTPAAASMAEVPPSWRRRVAGGAVALAILGALGVTLKMRASRPADPPVSKPPAAAGFMTPSTELRTGAEDAKIGEAAAGHRRAPAQLAATHVEPMAPVSQKPPPSSTAPVVDVQRPAVSRHLEVTEFDLGTRVVDHRLVDVRRDFQAGSVAVFLTRVSGGGPGQSIHHVWIHEGRRVQSIDLRLGSADWRTYSRKTLWGTGDWAVEARDGNGHVLARIEFRCVAASGRASGS